MSSSFKSTLSTLNLSLLNTLPTRYTNSSESLIDLILSSHPSQHFLSKTFFEDMSDHFIISTFISVKPTLRPRQIIRKRSFKNFVSSDFFDYCKYLPFHNISSFDSLDEKVNYLSDLIISALDLFAPFKQFRVRGDKKPWLSKFILHAINYKNKFFKYAQHSNCLIIWEEYKKIRNWTNQLIRNSKSLYYNYKLKMAADSPNQMFSIFRDFNSKTNKSDVSYLNIDGNITHNLDDIANALNKEFTSSSLPNFISFNPSHTTISNPASTSFEFSPPPQSFISKLIDSLPFSFQAGSDNIAPAIIKILKPLILPCLHSIFCQSLSEGSFHTKWKTAFVSPLHKKGPTHSPANYRPISKISCLSKLLEKIAYNQLYHYIDNNNLLSPKQFGFRKIFSIDSLLLLLISKWRSILIIPLVPLLELFLLILEKHSTILITSCKSIN